MAVNFTSSHQNTLVEQYAIVTSPNSDKYLSWGGGCWRFCIKRITKSNLFIIIMFKILSYFGSLDLKTLILQTLIIPTKHQKIILIFSFLILIHKTSCVLTSLYSKAGFFVCKMKEQSTLDNDRYSLRNCSLNSQRKIVWGIYRRS